MLPGLALVVITAVWGVTFVQVKDAVALYLIFLFLGLRFAIASLAVGLPWGRRLVRLGWPGIRCGLTLGVFLGTGYALQTLGLARTTVTSTGFIITLEPAFAGRFGYLLAGDRLGIAGWTGCGVIAEPAAVGAFRDLLRLRR